MYCFKYYLGKQVNQKIQQNENFVEDWGVWNEVKYSYWYINPRVFLSNERPVGLKSEIFELRGGGWYGHLVTYCSNISPTHQRQHHL